MRPPRWRCHPRDGGGSGPPEGGDRRGGARDPASAPVDAAAVAHREVAFTGRLASMSRTEATSQVERAGGKVVRDPTTNTSLLVVGQAGWPLRADGRPTNSIVRARRLKEQSSQLRIVSETTFLEILGLDEKVEDLRRLFTTAQLSRILDVPRAEIRAWMRRKLIRPVKVARRLAWFDFREVAMARALHSLTSSGVSPARIGKSIRELSQWLPDAERMLTQLETFEQGQTLSIRLQDGRLADPAGQLLFDFHRAGAAPDGGGAQITPFDPAAVQGAGAAATGRAEAVFDLGTAGPDELFSQGVRAEDATQWELAARLYERALELGGPQAETFFNLGNVLYELDRKKEAARRYLEAVEQDHEYVESLNNLGNALAETGWLNEAVHAYRRALELEPGYADAHSNLAETLVYLGRYGEARFHWNAYLELDPHSSWASAIRELLRNLPTDRN